MQSVNTRELLRLAEDWAIDGDQTVRFFSGTSYAASVATRPDPTKRALMRCAIQLVEALRSAPDFAEALRDLNLEPLGEDGKAP